MAKKEGRGTTKNIFFKNQITFRSLFDSKKQIDFRYFPRNASLLKPGADHEDLQKLIRFSQGYYTVEKWNDTIGLMIFALGQW